MTKDKVTRNDLRSIEVGKTEIYVLPRAQQLESVRSMCGYLSTYEGRKFTTRTDVPNKTIVVTRLS